MRNILAHAYILLSVCPGIAMGGNTSKQSVNHVWHQPVLPDKAGLRPVGVLLVTYHWEKVHWGVDKIWAGFRRSWRVFIFDNEHDILLVFYSNELYDKV